MHIVIHMVLAGSGSGGVRLCNYMFHYSGVERQAMEALMAKVSTEAEAFSKLSDVTKAKILSKARNLAVGECPATAGYDDRDTSHGDVPKDDLARFVLEGVPGT